MGFPEHRQPNFSNPFLDEFSPVRRTEEHSFLLPGIKSLRYANLEAPDGDRKAREFNEKNRSLVKSFMDGLKGQRKAQFVVVGPMEKGRLSLDDSLYQVYMIFPKGQEKSILTTSRDILLEYAPEGEDVEALVLRQPDIREETPFEKQTRLLREIKLIDRLIILEKEEEADRGQADDMSSDYFTDLHTQKVDRMLDYLETSVDIEDDNPDLDDIFNVADKKKEDRISFTMRYVRETNEIDILDGGESNPTLSEKEVTTSLKRSKIKEAASRYKDGSEDSYDEKAYELVELLIDLGVESLRED